MTTRRYDDDEVAEILALATRDAGSTARGPSTPSDGLTLEELQAIASDVGIAPTRIAEAARALERRATTPAPRMLLGAPRSVARMVPLERALDDAEWDRLVADLRTTFGAVGKVTTHGGLRSWSNGNLQAHVEPDGDGWRLRMQTFKGDAGTLASMGGGFALIGVLIFIMALLDGSATREMVVSLVFIAVGLGQMGYLRLSLPGWADERTGQMDAIADRLPALLKPPTP
ncbi:MAG: hypothetical protein LC667_18130 [Thioalkalivibrio sp.]|nr:hypothetical protein [Thioalkalivibrio sp.]